MSVVRDFDFRHVVMKKTEGPGDVLLRVLMQYIVTKMRDSLLDEPVEFVLAGGEQATTRLPVRGKTGPRKPETHRD